MFPVLPALRLQHSSAQAGFWGSQIIMNHRFLVRLAGHQLAIMPVALGYGATIEVLVHRLHW